MSVFIFLKTILDIRNIGKLFLEFFAFLKKNRLLPIVYSLPIIFFILYYLSYLLFISNKEFLSEKKRSEINKYIDLSLRNCGDKTAISISIVSSDSTRGEFYTAKACDFRQKGCIIDLKEHNNAYKDIYTIDPSSYQYLDQLTQLYFPSHLTLNKDNQQDLAPLDYLPTIRLLVAQTDWAKEGIVKDLWITASRSLNRKVLYVFTFKTAVESTSCQNEIQNILIELKNKMGGDKWL